MGDFHHPDICWRDNTAWQKQSRRFLECTDDDDNFLTQVIKEPTRRGALLDLTLTNKKELVCEGWGSPCCSDHEMVEFRTLRGRRWGKKAASQPWTSGEQGIFRDVLEESHRIQPWREEGSRRAD